MTQSKQNRKWLIAAALCLLVAAAAAAVFLYVYFAPADADGVTGRIVVHFLDVGQGDCTVIETPDGNILIDAGTGKSKSTIKRCIDGLGITEFAYAIFTHPHADHIGSAAALVAAYPIDCIIMPDAVSTSETYSKLLTAIEQSDARVVEGAAGKQFVLGALTIDLLAPCKAYNDLNNMSVVARLTYGDGSFLFTGDAEALSEADMLAEGVPACDILKVGHHGSSTSSSDAFIAAVLPQLAVVSVGEGNNYGHPHASTLERLAAYGAQVLRTDLCGNITVTCDGTQYIIETEK